MVCTVMEVLLFYVETHYLVPFLVVWKAKRKI